MNRIFALACVAVVGASVAVPAGLAAAEPVYPFHSSAAFELAGLGKEGEKGGVVGSAGDMNGDGRADLFVAAPRSEVAGRQAAGIVYVAYSSSFTERTIDLRGVGPGGMTISGSPPQIEQRRSVDNEYEPWGAMAGWSTASAGDVNGDGLSDLLIGAPGESPGLRFRAGAAYVVFGSRVGGDVDLGALGERGFAVYGDVPEGRIGKAASAAGDVNGDGLADLLLTAEDQDGNKESAYVVFGKRDSAPVDLRTLGPGGYMIIPGNPEDGYVRLESLGDANGDGRADVLLYRGGSF